MIVMDLNDMPWVGNLYEKFEALCLEVEENMYQDTVKYVENQVQTVGASVKKFYADVLQDLSPCSIDALKTQTIGTNIIFLSSDVTQDLSPPVTEPMKSKDNLSVKEHADIGIYKKPEVGTKESVRAEIKQRTKVSNIIANMVKDDEPLSFPSEFVKQECSDLKFEGHYDSGVCEQLIVRVREKVSNLPGNELEAKKYDEPDVKICTEILSSECIDDISVNCSSVDHIYLVKSIENEGMEMRQLFTDGTLAESTAISTCMGNVSVYEMGPSVDLTYCAESDDEASTSDTGSVEDWNVDSMIDTVTIEPGIVVSVEPLDGVKLEETRVLVDPSKSCFVSQKEVRRKSYKKKIRDAFSTKIKSGRKHEYEQLAVRYENIDLDFKQSVTTLTHKSVDQDLSESEWELV